MASQFPDPAPHPWAFPPWTWRQAKIHDSADLRCVGDASQRSIDAVSWQERAVP
jgi:hypothetical protein